jgi:pantothenate kinase
MTATVNWVKGLPDRRIAQWVSGGEVLISYLAARVRSRVREGQRYLLGITVPPAAGKSTLAASLVEALNTAHRGCAAAAPMDGFHQSSATLAAAGSLHRKGEPGTFDADGFLAILTELRNDPLGADVAWPVFDRDIEDPVPDATVFTSQRIAIVEGNYLLLRAPVWREVRPQLDEVWYLDTQDQVIEQRLSHRHRRGGKSPEETRRKIAESDLPNARLISSRSHADTWLRARGSAYLIEAGHPAPAAIVAARTSGTTKSPP